MTDTTRESVERLAHKYTGYGQHDVVDMLRALLTRAEAAEANGEKWRSMWEKEQSHNEELRAERDALQAKLVLAVDGLKASEAEIDAYILDEYPFGHPSLDRYRQRDYDSNPARIALATLTADTPKEGKDDER